MTTEAFPTEPTAKGNEPAQDNSFLNELCIDRQRVNICQDLNSLQRDCLKTEMLRRLEKELAGVKMELEQTKRDHANAMKDLVNQIHTLCTKGTFEEQQPVNFNKSKNPKLKSSKSEVEVLHDCDKTLEGQYLWKSSKSACASGTTNAPRLELLDCPPMICGGVYKWSVLVEEDFFSSFELGVIATGQNLDETLFVGDQGWGYFAQGLAYDNGTKIPIWNLEKLKKGSKVTFSFDLTGQGTLRARVDDGARSCRLFVDMLSKVDHEGVLFVPAVALVKPTRVRFLGFERVMEEDTKWNVTDHIVSCLEHRFTKSVRKIVQSSDEWSALFAGKKQDLGKMLKFWKNEVYYKWEDYRYRDDASQMAAKGQQESVWVKKMCTLDSLHRSKMPDLEREKQKL